MRPVSRASRSSETGLGVGAEGFDDLVVRDGVASDLAARHGRSCVRLDGLRARRAVMVPRGRSGLPQTSAR